MFLFWNQSCDLTCTWVLRIVRRVSARTIRELWKVKVYHSQVHVGWQSDVLDERERVQFSSVQFSLLSQVRVSVTPWTARQASRSITNSQSSLKLMSSSWWCHPTISSSVVPSSYHLRLFLASGSFLKSQFFASGGQSTGVSALASVLPMNI